MPNQMTPRDRVRAGPDPPAAFEYPHTPLRRREVAGSSTLASSGSAKRMFADTSALRLSDLIRLTQGVAGGGVGGGKPRIPVQLWPAWMWLLAIYSRIHRLSIPQSIRPIRPNGTAPESISQSTSVGTKAASRATPVGARRMTPVAQFRWCGWGLPGQ